MAKVVILSGAGLSAESGIKTFRGNDGLWEGFNVMEVCSVQGFIDDRQKVIDFYNMRRRNIEDKAPNEAHKMIARIQKKFPDDVAVLTQNVDDLLERAGCEQIVHLHGTLTDLRCEDCNHIFSVGYESQVGLVCTACESDNIRHNVVMFGESAPMYQVLSQEIDDAQLLVVIGTSGQVIDSAYLAQIVGHAVLNNIDIDEQYDQYFQTKFYEPTSIAAAKIEALIENFLEN
jgi:NAD-dependent deacetylase